MSDPFAQTDVDRLIAYGAEHPETFGALRVDGARTVVSFTNPEEHLVAVHELAEHPEQIEVVQARSSRQAHQRVHEAVLSAALDDPSVWVSVSTGFDHVEVALSSAGLALADRLWNEHGDELLITVAGQRYPLDDREVSAQTRPAGPRQTASWPSGLTIALELDAGSMRAGEQFEGHLVLHAATRAVTFDSGQPLDGELLDADGRRINDLSGLRTGTGKRWNLRPGQSDRVRFTVGVRCARLADGPHVPPGTWQLIVPIPVHGGNQRAPQSPGQLLAGPFPVVIP